MSKGITTILLIVIILAVGILAAAGGYYYGANSTATTTQLVTVAKTTAVGATTTAVDTANWKTYTNTDYGFSFKYPGDWKTEQSINVKTGSPLKMANGSDYISVWILDKGYVGTGLDATLIKKENVTINNANGTREYYDTTENKKYDRINILKDSSYYTIEIPANNSTADQILSTFRFDSK